MINIIYTSNTPTSWTDRYTSNLSSQNVLHVVDPGNRFVRGLDMLSGVLVYDSYFTMGTPTTLAVYDTENVPSILGMSNKHGIV